MRRSPFVLLLTVALLVPGGTDAGIAASGPAYLGVSIVGTCDQDADVTAGCIHKNVWFTNPTGTGIDFGGFQFGAAVGSSIGGGIPVQSPGSCWLLLHDGGTFGRLLPGRSCSVPVIGGATAVGTFSGRVDMLAPNSGDVLLSRTIRVTGVAPNSPVHFGKSVVGTCDQDADITAGCITRIARFTNMTDEPITVDGAAIGGVSGASFGLGDQFSGNDRCLALVGGPGLAPLHTCTVPVIGGATAIGLHVGAVRLLMGSDVRLSVRLRVFGIEGSD